MDSVDGRGRHPGGGAKERDLSASVTFIDLLFAIVISLGLPQVMEQPWFASTSWNIVPAYIFDILVILLGYSTLLLSWLGYHNSINRRGNYGIGWEGRILFAVDILILVGYWLLLVKFNSFLFVLCVLTLVYALYACWDWLRSRQVSGSCPRQWRRRGVTKLWALVLLVLLIVYAALQTDGSSPTPIEWVFVSLAHSVNFLYRWHKGRPSPKWLLDSLVFKRSPSEVS